MIALHAASSSQGAQLYVGSLLLFAALQIINRLVIDGMRSDQRQRWQSHGITNHLQHSWHLLGKLNQLRHQKY